MIPFDEYADSNEEIERLRDLMLQFSDAIKFAGEFKLSCPEGGNVTDFLSEITSPQLSRHALGCEKCARLISAVKEITDEV